MAIPWMTLLKTVPWTDVIANAPTVANGAKKLWRTVSGQPTAPEIEPPEAQNASGADHADLAGLRAELAGLRTTTTTLHQQMLTSSELIRELAEQNTALIKRMEAYRVRLVWLSGGVALLATVILAHLLGGWLG